jgi:hypothetical protein
MGAVAFGAGAQAGVGLLEFLGETVGFHLRVDGLSGDVGEDDGEQAATP